MKKNIFPPLGFLRLVRQQKKHLNGFILYEKTDPQSRGSAVVCKKTEERKLCSERVRDSDLYRVSTTTCTCMYGIHQRVDSRPLGESNAFWCQGPVYTRYWHLARVSTHIPMIYQGCKNGRNTAISGVLAHTLFLSLPAFPFVSRYLINMRSNQFRFAESNVPL